MECVSANRRSGVCYLKTNVSQQITDCRTATGICSFACRSLIAKRMSFARSRLWVPASLTHRILVQSAAVDRIVFGNNHHSRFVCKIFSLKSLVSCSLTALDATSTWTVLWVLYAHWCLCVACLIVAVDVSDYRVRFRDAEYLLKKT